MQPLIDLDDVSFVRQGNAILDHVSYQAHSGEHWVVLGPNGAGKTTLVSLCSARNYPSSGSVRILDEQLGRVEIGQLHAQIGLCSSAVLHKIPWTACVQETVLNAAYGVLATGREQIFEDSDIERCVDLMRAFGIDHLASRRISTLSDGERQRMMICRALMADPEILILDEPAAGVDLGAREELMLALSELAAYPRSPMMLLVTHHVEEIPVGFTHALLMNNGRIHAHGTVNDVVTSRNLSDVFGMDIRCEQDSAGRYHAVAMRK